MNSVLIRIIRCTCYNTITVQYNSYRLAHLYCDASEVQNKTRLIMDGVDELQTHKPSIQDAERDLRDIKAKKQLAEEEVRNITSLLETLNKQKRDNESDIKKITDNIEYYSTILSSLREKLEKRTARRTTTALIFENFCDKCELDLHELKQSNPNNDVVPIPTTNNSEIEIVKQEMNSLSYEIEVKHNLMQDLIKNNKHTN